MPSESPTLDTTNHSVQHSRSASNSQRSVTLREDSRGVSRSRDRSESRIRSRSRSRSRSRYRTRNRSYTPSLSRSRSPSRSRDGKHARSRSRSRSFSRSPSRPISSKIVIEHLTKNVYEAHLHEIFSSYGEIESLDLPMNRHFMTNKGVAYILFTRPSYAEAAIAHMHEAQLDGAVITVSIVLPRRRASPSQSPPRQPGRSYGDTYRHGPPEYRNGEDAYRPVPPSGNWRGRGGASRRGGRGRYRNSIDDRNSYRPGHGSRRDYTPSRSRSRSPRRSRSYSSRSRSRSRSQPGPPSGYRRRSPSYSNYASRSRSREPDRGGWRARGRGR